MDRDLNLDRRANVAGSLWMVAAMAAFAIEDVLIKAASAAIPIAQLLFLLGLGGACVFASFARWQGSSLVNAAVFSRPMRWRMVFEVVGRLFFVLAIALTPLSSATVILQATPIVVVAGAAVVFHENVGWRRWVAILSGLLGVVIILQPGSDHFSLLSILAVIGMVGFAGRDLASRAAPSSLGTAILGLYGFLAVALAGLAFSLWESKPFVLPDPKLGLLLAGALGVGVLAYGSLMIAMRTGEVSAVTPFRYSRLLFGIVFGVVLFDESITSMTIIGSGLIVLSGGVILFGNASPRSECRSGADLDRPAPEAVHDTCRS